MTQPRKRRGPAPALITCVLLLLVIYWLWPGVAPERTVGTSPKEAPHVSVDGKVATSIPAAMPNPKEKGVAVTELPYLGNVEAEVSTETVVAETESGPRSFPFTVYRRKDGVFLRAVYHQEGTPTFEEPASKIQRIMKTRDETVTDLPLSPPSARWQDLVTKFGRDLGEDMSKATEIVITYVNYKRATRLVGEELIYETSPLFLVHVYGAATIMDDFPDTPQNRRIRGSYTADGVSIGFDNVL